MQDTINTNGNGNGAATAERWAPVKGTRGAYFVSDAGNVVRAAAGRGTHPGRPLTPYRNGEREYVTLSVRGERQTRAVEDLVAEAFGDIAGNLEPSPALTPAPTPEPLPPTRLDELYRDARGLFAVAAYAARGAFRDGAAPMDQPTAEAILRLRDRLRRMIAAEGPDGDPPPAAACRPPRTSDRIVIGRIEGFVARDVA